MICLEEEGLVFIQMSLAKEARRDPLAEQVGSGCATANAVADTMSKVLAVSEIFSAPANPLRTSGRLKEVTKTRRLEAAFSNEEERRRRRCNIPVPTARMRS